MPLGEGVLLERGRQIGYTPYKSRYFAAIGLYSVKTVADRCRLAAYHNKHVVTGFLDLPTSMTLNDLEPPK